MSFCLFVHPTVCIALDSEIVGNTVFEQTIRNLKYSPTSLIHLKLLKSYHKGWWIATSMSYFFFSYLECIITQSRVLRTTPKKWIKLSLWCHSAKIKNIHSLIECLNIYFQNSKGKRTQKVQRLFFFWIGKEMRIYLP